MSDNSWQNKSYGDYFKSLEDRFNGQKSSETEPNGLNVSRATSNIKKSGGIYKVLRLRKSVLVIFAVIVLGLAAVIAITSGKEKNDDIKTEPQPKIETDKKEEEIAEISYSFGDDILEIPASNDAKCAVIIDLNTNTVIAARNPHTKAFPASTTKLMTLLVAAESLNNLEDTFTMTLDITDPLFVAEASVAGFLNGEQVSVKDLMYGTILPSGADAATGLAIMTAGSEEKFVELMNKKVEELGLEGTHFDNPTGLHSANNYSTAYDMAVILGAVLQNDLCKEIISTYQYTTAKTPQNPNGILLSSTLFDYMYGNEPVTATILGGKTGFVNESGYCIASYGKCNENGNGYIVVTLGNSSRWPAFHGQIDLYKEFAK